MLQWKNYLSTYLPICLSIALTVFNADASEVRYAGCNPCNNLPDLALQTALAAPGSVNTLHVLNYGNQTIQTYSVEYFPEMRYFHYEATATNSALKNEAQAHFVAMQQAMVVNIYSIEHSWELLGNEDKARNFIDANVNWIQKELDATEFWAKERQV